MQKIKKITSAVLMALPLAVFDVFLRLYIGNVVLDGASGYIIPVVFNILWITLICSLCVSLPKIAGRIVYALLTVIFGIWTFANYIYHCIFKQFLWIGDIIMAGEGSDYIGVIFDYVSPVMLSLIVIAFAAYIVIVCKISYFGTCKKGFIVPLICAVGISVVNYGFLYAAKVEKDNGRWEIWQRPALIYSEYRDSKKSMYTSGLYQYTYKSIEKVLKRDDTDVEAETAFAQKYFDKDSSENEMSGIFEGKNVIFVLMESIDDFLISEEYTPEIKRMTENGINFKNHFSPNMGAGYTFNSEFAANTGFYCPSNESSASIFTKNSYPQTIANRLKEKGYTTAAVHFNSRQFYNREVMYKKWGYDNYYCLMDYMPIEKCVIDSDAVKNDKVFELMTGKKPFMTYFITYSAHLPYDKEDNKLKGTKEYYPGLVNNSEDNELSNLRLLAHDTDEFFRILNERLEQEGIAEDTVIVAYTDHYAYGMNNKELLKSESINAGSEILEKTPFFVYCKGMKPKTVEKVTSTVDILPTMGNLLGLEKHTGLMGNDAFSDDGGMVYFSDGRWFDGNVLYKPGESDASDSYNAKINKFVSDCTRVNDFVVEYDFFQKTADK